MDDLKFFGGLAGITIFVIGLLIYIGRKLSSAAERNAESIGLPLCITSTGTTFFACVVAFWVYRAAVRVLAPRSNLGQYLGTIDGAAAVVFGSITFVAIAGNPLQLSLLIVIPVIMSIIFAFAAVDPQPILAIANKAQLFQKYHAKATPTRVDGSPDSRTRLSSSSVISYRASSSLPTLAVSSIC